MLLHGTVGLLSIHPTTVPIPSLWPSIRLEGEELSSRDHHGHWSRYGTLNSETERPTSAMYRPAESADNEELE